MIISSHGNKGNISTIIASITVAVTITQTNTFFLLFPFRNGSCCYLNCIIAMIAVQCYKVVHNRRQLIDLSVAVQFYSFRYNDSRHRQDRQQVQVHMAFSDQVGRYLQYIYQIENMCGCSTNSNCLALRLCIVVTLLQLLQYCHDGQYHCLGSFFFQIISCIKVCVPFVQSIKGSGVLKQRPHKLL